MIATLQCSGENEVHLAVKSAKAAFEIWRKKSGMERGQVLLEAARMIKVCINTFLLSQLHSHFSEGGRS